MVTFVNVLRLKKTWHMGTLSTSSPSALGQPRTAWRAPPEFSNCPSWFRRATLQWVAVTNKARGGERPTSICSPRNHLVQPATALQCRHHIIRCIIRWQQHYFNIWKKTAEALSVTYQCTKDLSCNQALIRCWFGLIPECLQSLAPSLINTRIDKQSKKL